MKYLNDSNNKIYINSINRNKEYIKNKLSKTRIKCLKSNVSICGTRKEILDHIKCGPAKNLINTFFRFKVDKCEHCNLEKKKVRQLDRAHCNNCDRVQLLEKSILRYFVNELTPVKIKDILIEFIKLHNEAPIYMLCKTCHIRYDSK